MKLKWSFDKNAAKEFLLEHVEKFVFAAVIVSFLALIADAIWAERFEREPDDLQRLAETADQYMTNIPPEPDRESVPFAQMILDNRPPREEEYRHAGSWNPRLVNPMELRDEPPVLLVRALRGSADYGAFNMRLAPQTGTETGRRPTGDASQGIRGQRWAVVTGLVPVREQEQAFLEFFRDRIKPTPAPDLPEYIYYRVERAEVDPYLSPSDPQQLKWTPLNLRSALAEADKNWGGTSPEVVDERFVHPRLAFPLGPRVGNDRNEGFGLAGETVPGGGINAMYADQQASGPWGEEVAHPPEIPLKREQLENEMDEHALPGDAPGERRSDEPDFDLPMRGDDLEYPGSRPGTRRPAYPRSGEGEGMRRPGGGMRMDDYGGEGAGMHDDQVPDYLLFRFFDYSVRPGRSYRYRVRLVLANPNYGVDEKFLASPELAEKPWIEKDRWSEPTAVIEVPRDTHVLIGTVHTRIRETDDPSGTVAVVKWLEDTGSEVHKDFRVTRGQQLDYPDTVIRDPRRARRAEMGEHRPANVGLLGPAAADAPSEEPETVDFVTGMLVLDLLGGDRLPGRDRSETEPGQILVMDHDGALHILSEAQDKSEYQRRTTGAEPPETETDMPDMMYEEGMMDDTMLLEGGPPRRRRPSRGNPTESP